MRNMSFALTITQALDRSKTVTRRQSWWKLPVGAHVQQCEKCQGLGKGGKIVHIHKVVILTVRVEPVRAITQEDVIAEGFPEWSRMQFIEFYCKHNKMLPDEDCNRIEFDYLD